MLLKSSYWDPFVTKLCWVYLFYLYMLKSTTKISEGYLYCQSLRGIQKYTDIHHMKTYKKKTTKQQNGIKWVIYYYYYYYLFDELKRNLKILYLAYFKITNHELLIYVWQPERKRRVTDRRRCCDVCTQHLVYTADYDRRLSRSVDTDTTENNSNCCRTPGHQTSECRIINWN